VDDTKGCSAAFLVENAPDGGNVGRSPFGDHPAVTLDTS
jgi:hypothetical protein